MTRRAHPGLAILVVALVAIGCTSTSPEPSPSGGTGPIPQPAPPEGLAVAPEDRRVDLQMPVFSNPTQINNPLFPVSSQQSVLLVGTVDDQAFRTEVTLLPYTRILEWDGQRVEVLVSQYVAFLDGRLHEIAYDLYAQADDGSVWYFGEDVFNFADGAIVDTHGTWIAGIDGPAAMIMPADPQVGDVYRPENIPGFVFEEVTVSSVDESLDGPFGPIEGGVIVSELHMDGTTEEKQFAPGYGEFFTASGGEVEALALAVPTDASGTSEPVELHTLMAEPLAVLEALSTGDADGVAASLELITAAETAYPADEIPALLRPMLDDAVERLSTAVVDGNEAATGQAAIDLGRLALDLGLRHRPHQPIETGRFDLWLAQLQLDAAAEDVASLNGDYFALDYVRERFLPVGGNDGRAELNLGMEELLSAIGDEDFEAAATVATEMRSALEGFRPTD